MKVLFCYDGPLYINNDSYYSIGFSDNVLERYHYLGEKVIFAVRVNEIQHLELNKLTKIENAFTQIVKCPNISTPMGFVFDYYKAKSILNKLIIESDYIVVRLPSVLGILCCLLAKKQRKKCIVEVVTYAKETLYYHSTIGKIIAKPFDIITKRCIYNADYVSYIRKRYLQKCYPTSGKQGVCPNVMLNNFDIEYKINRQKKNNESWKNRQIIIGSIGSVSEIYKGHEFVIKAIKKMRREGIDVIYNIVGSGNNERLKKISCHEGVSDYINFVGTIPSKKIPAFLDSIDIYIQPSLSEAQGRSLIEAMSRGCICIASSVGGMIELLPHNMRFDKGDVIGIVQLVNSIIELKVEEKNEISEKNINIALEYSNEIVSAQRKIFFDLIKCDYKR